MAAALARRRSPRHALSSRVGAPAVRVSIVITNHDYGRFLDAAVGSALAQTHAATEVVVVDDGSTDESRAVIAGYGGRVRPVLIEHGGQAAAINAGVAAATGDLVMLLDADDVLEPDAAAAMAAAWRPPVVRLQSLVRLIDEAGAALGGLLPSDPIPSGDAAGLLLRGGAYAATGTTGSAYSRACLARLLPIPEAEWRTAPDTYLLTLAPLMGPVAAVERVLGRVRVHGRNKWSMQRLDPDRLLEYVRMDERRLSLLRSRGRELGADVPADWLFRSPSHLQSRLALLRLDPRRHPYPADRPARVAARGVRAALRHEGYAVRKRLLLAGWFLSAGLLPRSLAAGVVRAGFLRAGRPAWLQRFIEAGRARRGAAA